MPWGVCTMLKDEGGLGLIDIATHGCILESKWVVRCMEGSAPHKILLRHCLLLAQHSGRIKGTFDLCGIISSSHSFHVLGSFIFKSIWGAWKKVASLVQWHFLGS